MPVAQCQMCWGSRTDYNGDVCGACNGTGRDEEPRRAITFDVQGDAASLVVVLAGESYGGDRNRPYSGQSHTCKGKRGQTMVVGLTMRDVADCIRRGQLLPCTLGTGDDFDPIAAIQNAMCEIERMMSIFPNIDHNEPMVIPTYTIDDD